MGTLGAGEGKDRNNRLKSLYSFYSMTRELNTERQLRPPPRAPSSKVLLHPSARTDLHSSKTSCLRNIGILATLERNTPRHDIKMKTEHGAEQEHGSEQEPSRSQRFTHSHRIDPIHNFDIQYIYFSWVHQLLCGRGVAAPTESAALRHRERTVRPGAPNRALLPLRNENHHIPSPIKPTDHPQPPHPPQTPTPHI